MTRFLFYTDLHLAMQAPGHRVDDYCAAVLRKLDEVYALANEHEVDAVLFGGDFFNRHRLYSYHVIDAAIASISSSTARTYAVIGQHDLVGHNKQTYRTSAMAHMERHCANFEVMQKPVELDDVVVYPCHWYDDIHERLAKIPTRKRKSILLAHASVTSVKMPFDTVCIQDVNCPYSAVLTGDIHTGIAPRIVNGTMFCNPGALARRNVRTDIDRHPKVAIIHCELGKDVSVDLVPLQHVALGEEVFIRSAVEMLKASQPEMDASRFIQGIRELEQDAIDIFDLLDKAAKSQRLPVEVRDYLLSKREGGKCDMEMSVA